MEVFLSLHLHSSLSTSSLRVEIWTWFGRWCSPAVSAETELRPHGASILHMRLWLASLDALRALEVSTWKLSWLLHEQNGTACNGDLQSISPARGDVAFRAFMRDDFYFQNLVGVCS